MPPSALEEVDHLLGDAGASRRTPPPESVLRSACSPDDRCFLDDRPVPGRMAVVLHCPACGSSHVAQMLGDNGGISYVCTACGHSWS